jgi:phenylalanyl-tRNA synthetase alpha chain
MSEQIQQVERIEAEAAARVDAAETLEELRSLDTELLGKRSALSSVKATLGGLDPEQRRTVGQAVNRAREAIEATIAARRSSLEADARRATLEAERLDLTEVLPGPRPVTSTW